jgi:membrane protein
MRVKIADKLRQNSIINILIKTYSAFSADKGNLLAAGLSYYLLFSLFPFALAVISVAGFVMQDAAIQEEIIKAIGNLLPVARTMIVHNLNGLIEARAATGLLGLIGLVWSASAFINALRNSLNAAWGIRESHPLLEGGLVNALMLVGALLAFMLFIWISTSVRFIYESNLQSSTIRPLQAPAFSKLLFAILSAVLIYAVILLLYKFVPFRRPRWRDIWLGALLATVAFEAIRYGFLWYVKHHAQYNLVYGSIGTVIALLAFVYLTSWALLFFARMSAVRVELKSAAT